MTTPPTDKAEMPEAKPAPKSAKPEKAKTDAAKIDPRKIPAVTLLDGPFLGLRQHSVTAGPDGAFEVFGRSEKDPSVVEYHGYVRVGDTNEAKWTGLIRTQPAGAGGAA